MSNVTNIDQSGNTKDLNPELTNDPAERAKINAEKLKDLHRDQKHIEDLSLKDDIRLHLNSMGNYNFKVDTVDGVALTVYGTQKSAKEYICTMRATSAPRGLMHNQVWVNVNDLADFKRWYETEYDR